MPQMLFHRHSEGNDPDKNSQVRETPLGQLRCSTGELLFESDHDILAAIRERRVQQVLELANIKNGAGLPLFEGGAEMLDFMRSGGSLPQAKAFARLEGNIDRPVTGQEVALLQRLSLNPALLADYLRRGLNPLTAAYYFGLQIEPGQTDFQGNSKPKALLLYQDYDHLGLYQQAFLGRAELSFLRSFLPAYDFRLRTISSTMQCLEEVDAAPQLDLFVMAGHGLSQGKGIVFGVSAPRYGRMIPVGEEVLATGANNLNKKMVKMKTGGTLFLNCCSGGAGRAHAQNIANELAGMEPHFRVISFDENVDAGLLRAHSNFPLRLTLAPPPERNPIYIIEKK